MMKSSSRARKILGTNIRVPVRRNKDAFLLMVVAVVLVRGALLMNALGDGDC